MLRLILIVSVLYFLTSCGESDPNYLPPLNDTYDLIISNYPSKLQSNKFVLQPQGRKQARVDFEYDGDIQRSIALTSLEFSSKSFHSSCTSDYEVYWGTEKSPDLKDFSFVPAKIFQALPVSNNKSHVLRFVFTGVEDCSHLSVSFVVRSL